MTPSFENSRRASPVRPWSECECFCIADYAGGRRAPCGWRGRWRDALRGSAEAERLCPRCRRETLMDIRPPSAPAADA